MMAVSYSIDDNENGIKLIKFLLDCGADINKKDKAGRSALLMACHWNIMPVIELLMQYKPDINATTDREVD